MHLQALNHAVRPEVTVRRPLGFHRLFHVIQPMNSTSARVARIVGEQEEAETVKRQWQEGRYINGGVIRRWLSGVEI